MKIAAHRRLLTSACRATNGWPTLTWSRAPELTFATPG
jgi:hypothetical protein